MRRSALSVAAFALVTASCSRPEVPVAERHGPATLEEARDLAARRNVPVLVDFWSPT